jgi:hypothetical protein
VATGIATISSVEAACPAGSPCETIHVYRVQTWPGLRYDNKNIDLLSLEEANAASLKAFADVVKGYAGGGGLALRFTVTRIADNPNAYCNCNFERQNKACRPPITDIELRECVRVCRYNDKECIVAGVDVKSSGSWYAFPKATEWQQGKVWKKNAFAFSANNADWSAQPPAIKRASCIGTQITQHPSVSIDSLFDSDQPCPTVSSQQLATEEIAR